jgi:hypothetical protein
MVEDVYCDGDTLRVFRRIRLRAALEFIELDTTIGADDEEN